MIPVAPPDAAARRLSIVMWTAVVILIASMFEFLNVNAVWLRPLARDLIRWLTSPQIAGSPTLPGGWEAWLLLYGLAAVAAWPATKFALSGTSLSDDHGARIGTAVILTFAIVGYAGVIAVAGGWLEPALVWGVVGTAATLGAVVWILRRKQPPRDPKSKPASDVPSQTSTRIFNPDASWIGWPLVVGVVAFSMVHSIMAPITEIDATIYHAAAAKLWFLSRPDPGLMFGPSVGIEISANYPPLFPAIGASTYTVLGFFDDFYVRILPPLIGCALLLITFSYARWHSGRTVAWWVLVLLLGSPLLVMYMAWTTNYILLAALSLLVLMFSELAASSDRWPAWVAAGVFAGLAILTNFYGWVTLGFGILAMFIWMRSRRGVRSVALFVVVAGIVAAPWLIRNWVRLGDPIYPLADGIFHGAGLVQPLWGATQAEIEGSALSVFWPAQGFGLRSLEGFVALESNYLIPAGLTVGLVVGLWRALHRDKRAIYLCGVVVLLLVEVLTPGWFWLRALLPLVPIGAILTGLAIGNAFAWADAHRGDDGTPAFGAGLWKSALVGVGVVSLASSLALSFAGPNQETWTTYLSPSDDFLGAVRNLGSPERQFQTAYGGDYASWQWLNAHLGPGDRVATLEIRMYYFDRPRSLFYLDGIESVPLVSLNTPDSVRTFLMSNHVSFILIPGWARAGPASRLLPLMYMLDSPGGFPLVEQWGSTAIYSVSGT